MSIPFLDLQRIHAPLLPQFEQALRSIVGRSAFINGDEVVAFEKAFATWVGSKYCVGVSSGLDAAVIGLRAVGLKQGDRVIVPAMTFIATIEAVSWAGGVPVLVDVNHHGLMDLEQAEAALKAGAKFILPVHLFGHTVDPSALKVLAKKYSATVFEDACQAHGATAQKQSAGTIGRAAAFSFYPGKNLGALGDAGAICTDDETVVNIAKALREHGQTKKNQFDFEGYTARLDTLQAAFLQVKLPHLRTWNEERRIIAKQFRAELGSLKGLELQCPEEEPGHVYHLFVVLSKQREALATALKQQGIGFGMHYPVPIQHCPCYAGAEWAQKKFPWAERYATEGLSLPIFPGMTGAEVFAVIAAVKQVHHG